MSALNALIHPGRRHRAVELKRIQEQQRRAERQRATGAAQKAIADEQVSSIADAIAFLKARKLQNGFGDDLTISFQRKEAS